MGLSGQIGAGFGAGLEDILARQLLEARAKEEERARRAQEALQQQGLSQRATEHADEMGVRGRQLDAADADRRYRDNRTGVEDMMAQRASMDAQESAQAQQAGLEQASNDASLPENVRKMVRLMRVGGGAIKAGPVDPKDFSDPGAEQAAGLADYEARKKIDARYRPADSSGGGGFTRSEGQTRFGPAAESGPDQYRLELADRTITAADDLIKETSPLTTGVIGGVGGKLVGPARDYAAKLNTLAANIAFNALQEMRSASKTGGALGQVSDREGQLLSSVLGSLDQFQSPGQMIEQLKQVKASAERWKNAVKLSQAGAGIDMQGSHSPAGPTVGTERVINGTPARWDGKGWVAK